MARYVVIDFETANETRSSACSVGVVRVDDGAISQSWTSLIDPEVPFAPMNTSIHGITEDDVRGAPLFPEVLERILQTAEGAEALVAHGAAFDMQVLTGMARRYGVVLPQREFACTRVFAKCWFPGWPSYSLMYAVGELGIAEALGGDMHHLALWDAGAAMLIAEQGLQRSGLSTWAEAARALHISLGSLGGPDYVGCSFGASGKIDPQRRADLVVNPDHPLYGMNVSFTGSLSRYSRRDAAQAVVNAGGDFTDSITKRTDLLVVGAQDLAKLNGHDQSSKMRKAADMASQGHSIEIIDESEFYQLLSV